MYKFYAIRTGRQTGIVEDYQQAAELVKGFSNAQYHGFNSKKAAMTYLKTGKVLGKKQLFYAVKKGRQTGIFRTWEETYDQVHGYPNARYLKFKTEKEALDFLSAN